MNVEHVQEGGVRYRFGAGLGTAEASRLVKALRR